VPQIQIKLIENAYSPEQKKEMITRLTGAMRSIVGDAADPVSCIVIEEPQSNLLDCESRSATIEALQALVGKVENAAPIRFEEMLQYI
jgi:4-oxalocrotonate tautomerase